jgi:two-component system, OmpR family, alkaline phosphatase synthesis response regulator PhoP
MSKQKILLVDDEQDILDLLSYNLDKEGYEVHTATNGLKGVELARQIQPDLIILDVMMPEMDGMEACKVIREDQNLKNVLVAFLTARNEDYSQIAGFDSGADDYIAKPIKTRVFISRIKALLRRNEAVRPEPVKSDQMGIAIDKDRYIVSKDGQELSLPKKEFELLALLLSQPGRVFTRDFILSTVWGNDVIVGDRTIDVHIRKLREKLGDDHFKTIKGVGYKFEA